MAICRWGKRKGAYVGLYSLSVLKKKMTFLRVWAVVLTAAINAVDTVVEVDAVAGGCYK